MKDRLQYVWCFVFALVATWCISAVASAQCPGGVCPLRSRGDTGAASFAATLSQSRGLFHDRSYSGAEVVFKSSGVATPEAAHAAWQNSPPHRALVNAGAITDVQCVGNSCVGRGAGVSTTVARSSVTTFSGRQPVRQAIRRVFRR